MRINPIDIATRAVAVPAIAWSVTGALLASRGWDGIERLPEAIASARNLAERLRDDFFRRVEDQFSSRWIAEVYADVEANADARFASRDDDDLTSAA